MAVALQRAQAARSELRTPGVQRWTGYLLVLPAVAMVAGVLAYPLIYNAWLSLTDAHNFHGDGAFVGLANYQALLTSQAFWLATGDTLALTLVTATVALAVGIATALLLWWRFWGRSLIFLAVFVPWSFPAAFSAFSWYWLLMPPFHSFYTQQALAGRFWLEGIFGLGAWQVLSIGLMDVWRSSSIVAIFLLAGFNAIPEELLAYARLEVRPGWRYFRYVIAPLTRRYLVLASLVALAVSYTEYVSMYVETGGRIVIPILGTMAFIDSRTLGENGPSAALSMVQLALGMALALAGLWLVDRKPKPAPKQEDYTWHLLQVPTPSRRKAQSNPLPKRDGIRHVQRALPVLGSIAALAVMVFHLFPVYFVAIQAVRPISEFHLGNMFWAYHPDFSGVLNTLHDPVLARWSVNTLVIFGLVLVLGLAAALMAGYGMARLRVRGSVGLTRLLFCCYFVPQTAVVLPLYQVYAALGLDNTLLGLVLVYFIFAIPFATWLFSIYFQGLDTDVEDHALLDAGRFTVFRRIVLPMAWPVVIAAGLFAIGMIGSDVVYAGTFALSNDTQTLPGGLGITSIDLEEWASTNAAILISSVPFIAVCAGLSRYFVRGLRSALLEGA